MDLGWPVKAEGHDEVVALDNLFHPRADCKPIGHQTPEGQVGDRFLSVPSQQVFATRLDHDRVQRRLPSEEHQSADPSIVVEHPVDGLAGDLGIHQGARTPVVPTTGVTIAAAHIAIVADVQDQLAEPTCQIFGRPDAWTGGERMLDSIEHPLYFDSGKGVSFGQGVHTRFEQAVVLKDSDHTLVDLEQGMRGWVEEGVS
jgi:hypothetical protein